MATQPWLSEREITGHQAIRLIESQFTELSPVQLHLLGIGWDNTVFQVNHRWTFRFPRRQIALPLMATEWKLLADLSMYLDIPVPVPHFKGQATIEFPWPFVGYGMVEGQTACRVSLTERQRQRMAPRLGAILRHLHDFSPRKAQELALPPDTMGKTVASNQKTGFSERYWNISALVRHIAKCDPTRTPLLFGAWGFVCASSDRE